MDNYLISRRKLEDELNSYVHLAAKGFAEDVLNSTFWLDGHYGYMNYPYLSRIARVVMSLTVTNAPLESAFSTLRFVDDGLTQRASSQTLFAKFFSYFNK